jgi:prepilin-type N-terminal cleavage/methylation domain-containing protein
VLAMSAHGMPTRGGVGRVPCSRRGFTLIELLVVIAMIGVLLGLAAPNFMAYRRNAELSTTANDFLAALSAARAEAMKRQLRSFVVPADGANWTSGWIVFVDVNSNVAAGSITFEPTIDFEVNRREALPSSLAVPLSAASTGFDDGGAKYAMFNGSGFMTLVNGAFPAGGAHSLDITNGTESRRILANATGRLRVCKPAVVAGLPHLVIHRGLSGQAVVVDDADRSLYLGTLVAAAREAEVAVHAYGLFANEVRLLVTPSSAPSLGKMMQAVGRRYVRAFTLRHERSGTPWEGRFRSTVVEPAGRLIACLRFAEGSDADGMGLASDSEMPRWCSVAHHLGLAADGLISEHAAFWALGNTPFDREAAYRRLLAVPVPQAEREAIRDAALKGWAWGSAAFVAQLGADTSRRPRPLRRGRPVKTAAVLMARS